MEKTDFPEGSTVTLIMQTVPLCQSRTDVGRSDGDKENVEERTYSAPPAKQK
ncbi:hypothetical protein NQZ68_005735 [Dissostichus eleginoides]|nr:hypothetical protein NQZ68_005735 [Dissostichus eleginoides]